MVRAVHTSAEAENRAAFLVQLSALFTNVAMTVNSTALSSSNKARLTDIRTAVEEWVKEIGTVGAPRPSIIPSSPADTSAASDEQQQSQEHVGADAEAETQPAAAAAADQKPSASPSPPRPDPLEPSNSFTAIPSQIISTPRGGERMSACSYGAKTIVDTVAFMKLLFASGIPESPKLRAMARNMSRLVTVRCTSTIMAALQYVAHHTYSSTGALKQSDDAMEFFVLLSQEIRLSTEALQGCLELVTFSADLSDASAAKFPFQLCVDVIKQVRRVMNYFQLRLEKEELSRMRKVLGEKECHESDLEAYAQQRAEDLKKLWGPSLSRSIIDMGCVLPTAVSYLISVASISDIGSSAELVSLRVDAQNDLFALSDPCPSILTPPPSARQAAAATSSSSAPRKASSPTEVSGVEEEADSPPEEMRSMSSLGQLSSMWKTAAASVALRLGYSFLAEYATSVAEQSGDESDGRLVATRVMADTLRHMTSDNPAIPRFLTTCRRWQRRLFQGLLNCLVSLKPAVLCAALDSLHIIVTHTASNGLCQEVGFLYSNSLFRLLESDNCPQLMKKHIVVHLLTTFFKTSSTETDDTVPILLHIYRAYDLNVHAHELNVVQQFITVLSRIVRQAPRSGFTQDSTTTGSAIAAPDAAGVNGAKGKEESGELFSAQQSLPSLALHGLTTTVDIIGSLAPPEEESGKDTISGIPSLGSRVEKLKEQQLVDLFNTSPKKLIEKHFHVTKEEMNPPREEKLAMNYECDLLPEPASEATKKKIDDIVTFLRSTTSLSPESVAEFLTMPAVFPLQVCCRYMEQIDMVGYSVLDSLKELLATVQLPKEGQKIERLLEYFCVAYYKANSRPGVDRAVFPFNSSDACIILVVATVMLNTNLHNPLAGGHRMTEHSFKAQLRGCNQEKDFPPSFLDYIFTSISLHPLGSIKGLGAATLSGNSHNSTAVETHSSLDALFISYEERRQIAFGLERQRVVSDTHTLLERRSTFSVEPIVAEDEAKWWCAAARDLFLSSWSAVCAVFGPAMYEGDSPPQEVLVKCIRGLQSLMCVAASFALSTECEVMLLALLRMCVYDSVCDLCRNAVLVVASTAYSAHFSPRCWFSVFSLSMGLRQQSNAMQSQVENMLARIESYTRLSCEDKKGSASLTGVAVRRVLEGITDLLREVAVGDGLNLSTGLYFLQRCLGYSLIAHSNKRDVDVAHYVNIRDFSQIVLPRLSQLVVKHRSSDEALQVLFEFAVDRLGTMWASYTTYSNHHMDVTTEEGKDAAPRSFVDCYDFFKICYCECNGPDGTLVKTHLLQGVKELITRTLRSLEVCQSCKLGLYTIVSAWRRVLYTVTRALSDKDTMGTEVSSLAGLVLRKLVVLCAGTAAATGGGMRNGPFRFRAAALVLLANVSYIGSMCSDVDSAQVCLAQLPTICTAALAAEESMSSSRSASPGASPIFGDHKKFGNDSSSSTAAETQPDVMVQRVLAIVEGPPSLIAQHALERLVLTLRCDREQTRAEAVENLRTLSMQLQPAQVEDLALHIAEVLLEATVGYSREPYVVHITDPSLVSFWLLLMDVPPTLKRCSRSSFRTTLPAALGLVTNELLSVLPAANVRAVAELLMERCLVPMIVSPSVNSFQTRSLAARSLTQCAMFSLTRAVGTRNDPERIELFPLRSIISCISMVLYCFRIPIEGIVPADAEFTGRTWLQHPKAESERALYGARVQEAMNLLINASPRELSGNWRSGSISGTEGLELPESAATTTENGAALPKPPAAWNPLSSSSSERFVSDEELIDYCNLLVQILPGLPKIISSVGVPMGEEEDSQSFSGDGGELAGWHPPTASPAVLVDELLGSAGRLFAALWRVRHPQDTSIFMSRHLPKGRDAPSVTLKGNNALLPHAAIRGALNGYVELAVYTPDYPLGDLLAVTVDVVQGIRGVQVAGSGKEAAGGSAADTAALQRLSPQEQQHIRTCTVGMYQELSVVLSYWVRAFVNPPAQLPAARLAELRSLTLNADMFKSLVSLLTPNAGSLIVTVRDYFAWYISQKELEEAEAEAEAVPGLVEESCCKADDEEDVNISSASSSSPQLTGGEASEVMNGVSVQ